MSTRYTYTNQEVCDELHLVEFQPLGRGVTITVTYPGLAEGEFGTRQQVPDHASYE
jgi:hypothetical protein